MRGMRVAGWGIAMAAAVAATGVGAGERPDRAIQLPPPAVKWGPAAPVLPPGTQAAVLEGDPKKPGIFTMRLKVPAGAKLPPHWHPRDERVTVLSGLVAVGFGDVMDEAAVTRFPAGSFYVNPAKSHHYVLFPEGSEIQITGEGPWELHPLKP